MLMPKQLTATGSTADVTYRITKFSTTMKTIKYSSSVVQIRIQQKSDMVDGRHGGKYILKLLQLLKGLTDLYEVWYAGAEWAF